MVQAMINIDERSNRVLNIIKAKYGFKDKSQTIDFVMSNYEENFLEPELRPEFVKRMLDIERNGKFRQYSSVDELRRDIENAKD